VLVVPGADGGAGAARTGFGDGARCRLCDGCVDRAALSNV